MLQPVNLKTLNIIVSYKCYAKFPTTNPTSRLMACPEATDRQYSLGNDYYVSKYDFCAQSAAPGKWRGRASWKHKRNVGRVWRKCPPIQREWLSVLRGLAPAKSSIEAKYSVEVNKQNKKCLHRAKRVAISQTPNCKTSKTYGRNLPKSYDAASNDDEDKLVITT